MTTIFEVIEQPKLEWAKEWLKETKRSFINGYWVTGDAGVIDSINPATGKKIGEFTAVNSDQVSLAVDAAKVALKQDTWKAISRKERAKKMRTIAELIRNHQAELATLEALDNGKLYSEAYNDDIAECADLFDYYAGWTDKYYTENNPVDGNFLSVTTADPIGVCGQIVPFNFPLQMACLKMAPALAMGNTVILKPADKTSFSAIRLFEIIDENKVLPPGVINLTLGGKEVGNVISTHPKVDKLSFTGSTFVGKQLIRDSADSNLKPVTLELGGKSPNIIFSDCKDLDAAIERSLYGLFTHKAEKCSAPTR